MVKDELIPLIVIVEPGQCDQCLGPISIIEQELNLYDLSPNGYPVNTENLYQHMYGFCPKCKKRFDMIKVGMGFEKYSRSGELYREYMKSTNQIDDRDKDLRDSNPFATIARRYKKRCLKDSTSS